jgi:hypothetical protein
MTLGELLAVNISLVWFATGAALGLRFGCFAALGIGVAAWFVGLVLGAFVLFGHEDLDRRCQRLAERRPRLGTVLSWAEGLTFLSLYLVLLVGPIVLLSWTRALRPD